jgi:hypothetical protein
MDIEEIKQHFWECVRLGIWTFQIETSYERKCIDGVHAHRPTLGPFWGYKHVFGDGKEYHLGRGTGLG